MRPHPRIEIGNQVSDRSAVSHERRPLAAHTPLSQVRLAEADVLGGVRFVDRCGWNLSRVSVVHVGDYARR